MPRPRRTKVASTASIALSSEAVDKKSKKSKPSVPIPRNGATMGKKTRQTTVTANKSMPDGFKISGAYNLPTSTQETASSERPASAAAVNKNGLNDTYSRTTRLRTSSHTEPDSIPSVPYPAKEIRPQTPEADHSTDSDLYGLSPSGEISRAKIEAQQESRRASLMQPQSAIKALSTPSIETSILALNKFKRRKRQPSIIRQMQEASELGSVDDFDLDDFDPENESTPLHLTNKAAEFRNGEPRTSSSRKRRHSEMIQVSVNSTPTLSSPNADDDLPQELTVPTTGHTEDAESLNDILAPPLSSSSDHSPPHPTYAPSFPKNTKTVGDNTKRRRRVTKVSTDVLQSFLPRTRTRKSRRQQNKRNEFDLSQSTSAPNSDDIIDLNSDISISTVDEPKARKQSNKASASAKSRTHQIRSTSSKQPRRMALAENNTAQVNPQGHPKGLTASAKQNQRQTYGKRAVEEDKENENDDLYAPNSNNDVDESTLLEEVSRSKELVKMKNKFAEIDGWEMEFESVDLGGSSSSSWR